MLDEVLLFAKLRTSISLAEVSAIEEFNHVDVWGGGIETLASDSTCHQIRPMRRW